MPIKKVVLNSQQLKRVLTVAVDEVGLQFSKAIDLPGDIGRISQNGRKGDQQTQDEADGG